MMKTRAETEFHREVLKGGDRLRREIGYNPIRFNQMVADFGGPEAARLLLSGRDPSDGFSTLWEAGRLEMSVEAIALLPWYESLFTNLQRASARRRLLDHEFALDDFLARRTARPPTWTRVSDVPS